MFVGRKEIRKNTVKFHICHLLLFDYVIHVTSMRWQTKPSFRALCNRIIKDSMANANYFHYPRGSQPAWNATNDEPHSSINCFVFHFKLVPFFRRRHTVVGAAYIQKCDRTFCVQAVRSFDLKFTTQFLSPTASNDRHINANEDCACAY